MVVSVVTWGSFGRSNSGPKVETGRLGNLKQAVELGSKKVWGFKSKVEGQRNIKMRKFKCTFLPRGGEGDVPIRWDGLGLLNVQCHVRSLGRRCTNTRLAISRDRRGGLEVVHIVQLQDKAPAAQTSLPARTFSHQCCETPGMAERAA